MSTVPGPRRGKLIEPASPVVSVDRGLAQRQTAGRLEILDAAAVAFTERGYAATSIDTIADLLGSTKGRVYHYYRTKGEIFLDLHRRALDIAHEVVAPIAESDAPATSRLRAMIQAHVGLITGQYHLFRVAAQPVDIELASEGRTRRESLRSIVEMRDSYEALFRRVIQAGVTSKELRAVDPKLASKVVLGALNWMVMWYRPDGVGASPDAIAAEIAAFALDGLSRRPPVARRK